MTPSSDQAAAWRRRIPRALLQVLVLAVVLLWFQVGDLRAEPPGCAVPDDCRYPLDEVVAPAAYGLLVAAVPLAVVLPRAAVWVAAVGVLLQTRSAETVPEMVTASWPTTGVLALLGLLDLAGRHRQRALASSWAPLPTAAPVLGPIGAPDPSRLPWHEDTRRLAAVLALGVLLVAGGLTAWQQVQVSRVRAFEARAHRAVALVEAVPEDGPLELLVDGRRERVEHDADLTVGQQVPVLVDADDPHHVVLVAEPADPGGLLEWVSALLAFAAAVCARLWTRGVARTRLVSPLLPALHLRIGREGEVLMLTTADDERFARPLAAVTDVEPARLLTGCRADVDAALEDGADDWDEDTLPEELAAFPPVRDGGTPATVLGLRCDGSPVRILRGDDDLVSTPVTDPWLWRQQRRRWRERSDPLPQPPTAAERAAVRASSAVPLRAPEPLSDERWAWLARAALPLLAPVGLPLAHLVALAAGPATAMWLAGDASFWRLLRVLVSAAIGVAAVGLLTTLRQPVLAPHPLGLRRTTAYSRQVIARGRVHTVVARRSDVLLRLRDTREPVRVVPEDLSVGAHRWDEGAPAPQEVAETIESWLQAAAPGTPEPERRARRVTAAMPPAVILVVGMLGAWLVTRLGG